MESRTEGSRPRTQKKFEAKDSLSEDRTFRGQRHKGSEKKYNIKVFKNFFQVILKNKKVFKKVFQGISKKQGLQKIFSCDLQNFNNLKNSAVLQLRTGQFLRT